MWCMSTQWKVRAGIQLQEERRKSRGICYCIRLQRVEWKSREVAARIGKIWKLLKYKINHLRPNEEERGPGDTRASLLLPWLVIESKPKDNFIDVSHSPPPQLDEVRVFLQKEFEPCPRWHQGGWQSQSHYKDSMVPCFAFYWAECKI